MGEEFATFMLQPSMACHRAEITSFVEHVWLFYIEAASQIKKRLPLDDEVLKSLTFLDPNAFYLK